MSVRLESDGGASIVRQQPEQTTARCTDCTWWTHKDAPRLAREHSRTHNHVVIVERASWTFLWPPRRLKEIVDANQPRG